MSEGNLHRCINLSRIQASDLEKIAELLQVDVLMFFGDEVRRLSHRQPRQSGAALQSDLLDLCRALVGNFRQRDDLVGRMVSMMDSANE